MDADNIKISGTIKCKKYLLFHPKFLIENNTYRNNAGAKMAWARNPKFIKKLSKSLT